jgi:hypothetical protein
MFGIILLRSHMPTIPIPIDILLHILEHVDKAGLRTICLLNKVCCSCSQDVLYRDIRVNRQTAQVCQTLAQSTHLAIRVRSFKIKSKGAVENYEGDLQKSLENMTYLRHLRLHHLKDHFSGCTFRLVSFACDCFGLEPLLQFLSSQPSLTDVALGVFMTDSSPEFGATFLPNLTRITGNLSWLPQLIPNRPVNDVTSLGDGRDIDSVPTDLSFFSLSTVPIQKLTIHFSHLHPRPAESLAFIFPSLTHLKLDSSFDFLLSQLVSERPFFLNNWMISNYVPDLR